MSLPRIAVSIGDPAGVGLDLDRVGMGHVGAMVVGAASMDREASARAARGC